MFLDMPGNQAVEEAVSWPFQTFPRNTDLGQVLPKVILLNSLYATGIMDVQRMAGHIHSLGRDLDAKLESGDLSAVADISTGHQIRSKLGKEYCFHSFATKYLHWHIPTEFPIFDNLVSRILPKLNREFHFHEPFYQYDLGSYPLLRAVLDSLTTYLSMPEYRYKGIDKGLWVYGKAIYASDLPKAMSAEVAQLEQRLFDLCRRE